MENKVNKKYFTTQGAKHTTYGVVKEERTDDCVCAIVRRSVGGAFSFNANEIIPTSIINHASPISEKEFQEQWI